MGREGSCLQSPCNNPDLSSENDLKNPRRASKTTFWESKQGKKSEEGKVAEIQLGRGVGGTF